MSITAPLLLSLLLAVDVYTVSHLDDIAADEELSQEGKLDRCATQWSLCPAGCVPECELLALAAFTNGLAQCDTLHTVSAHTGPQ